MYIVLQLWLDQQLDLTRRFDVLDTDKEIPGIGTFQEYYQINLLKQYSPSEISWIPSLQIFIMFAMVSRK